MAHEKKKKLNLVVSGRSTMKRTDGGISEELKKNLHKVFINL